MTGNNRKYNRPEVQPTGSTTDRKYNRPEVKPTGSTTDRKYNRPEVQATGSRRGDKVAYRRPEVVACAHDSEEHRQGERSDKQNEGEEEHVWNGLRRVFLVAGRSRQIPAVRLT